ncbi:MAG TPA: cupin domain-containing protein [Pyrinomonadaceae bacterium]|nr:cupin domain-containing protein [Pyrinomonadaceae bacterium]
MHAYVDDELKGQAALYSLGALDAEEARAFEAHIAEGCAACAAELREFAAVAADLRLAPPQAEPPAGALKRLLARVSDEAQDASASVAARPSKSASGFLVVRANEGEWVETDDEGVCYKLLFADRELGTYTTLLRLQPGARIPRHRHLGVEQCLVLEGDLSAGSIKMSAGDFNCSLPNSIHDEIATEGGALLLIVSPEKYEVVGPCSSPGV